MFERIDALITEITTSPAYVALHNFIFGNKETGESHIPNLFERIDALITEITTSSGYQSLHNFIFGGGDENEPNIFYKIKYAVQDIADSPAFQAIHDFIFGKKKSDTGNKNTLGGVFSTKEEREQLNILERIRAILWDLKTYFITGWDVSGFDFETLKETVTHVDGKLITFIDKIKEITSSVLNSINTFRKWLGLDWEKTETGFVRIPGALDKVKTKIDAVISSKTFQDIKSFFFGEKDAEGKVVKNNIFSKIGTAVEELKTQFLGMPDVVLDFFLGPINEEGKRTENLFKRLPDYITNAKDALIDFFLGKKIHKGTVWSDELNRNVPLYEREGNLIERLKEKFESLREAHPWLESICKFITNQIQKITGLVKDANGNISIAINNLKSYLFGGNIEKQTKNELGEIVSELTPVNGVVKDIRENIEKLFSEKKDPKKTNFLTDIKERLGIFNGSTIQSIAKLLLGLMGLSVLFTRVDLGKFGEWGFSSALDNFTETIKDFAIALGILAATLVGITFFVKVLKNDYKSLAEAGIIIFLLSKLLMNIFTSLKLIETEENGMKYKQKMSFGSALALKLIIDALTQLVALVAALALFIKLGKFSNGEVAIAVGIIAGLMLLMGYVGKMMIVVAEKGKTVKTAAPAFFAFAAILFGLSKLLTTMALVFGGLYLFTKGHDISEYATVLELMKIGLIAIASMIGVIALAITMIGSTAKNITGSAALLVVSVMGGLAAVIFALIKFYPIAKNADWKSMAAMFGGMVLMLLSVSASIAMISGIKKINGPAIAAILLLPVLIQALSVIAFGISYLASKAPLSDLKNLGIFFGVIGAVILLMLPVIGMFSLISNAKQYIKDTELYAFGEIIVALLELITVISTVFWLISKLQVPDLSTLGIFFAGMAGVLLLMLPMIGVFKVLSNTGKAIKSVEAIDFLDIYFAIAGIALLVSLIMGLTSFIPAGSWATVGKFLAIMAGIIAGMWIIPDIFKKIQKAGFDKIKPDQITNILKSFAVMEAAIGMLAILAGFILGWTKLLSISEHEVMPDFGPLIKMMLAITVFTALMPMIINVFNKIDAYGQYSKIDTKETLLIFSSMAAALGIIALAAGIISIIITSLSAGHLMAGIGDLFKFIIAMYSVIGMFYLISDLFTRLLELNKNMTQDMYKKVLKSLLDIAVLFIAIGSATALLLYVAANVPVDNLVPFLKFIAAMAVVAVSLVGIEHLLSYMISVGESISKQKFDSLVKAFAGILVFAVILGGLVVAINDASVRAGDLNGFYSFILAMASVGVTMAVLSKVISDLAKMSTKMLSANGIKDTAKFIGSVIAITLVLGGLIYILSKVAAKCSNISAVLPLIAAIGATGVLVLALSGIVALVYQIGKWSNIFGNVKKVLGLFLGVSAILVGLTALVAGLAWASTKIKDLGSLPSLIKAIIEVAGAILALSLIVTAIGFVGKLGKGVILDAAIFMAEIIGVITIIGLVIAAIGWLLNKLEEIEGIGEGGIIDSINKFGEMFEALSNALGRGIGGLIGGIGEGLTDSLRNIGENLSAFMIALSPFLYLLQSLNESHKTGIGILTSVMAGILEATFYEKITTVLSYLGGDGDLNTVVTNLKDLTVNSLIPFLNAIKDITDESLTDLDNFNSIMLKILEATFYNSIANILSHLGSNGDLPGVVSNLNKMVSENLKPFLTSISTITPDDGANIDTFNGLLLKIIEAEFFAKIADIISHIGGQGDLPGVIRNLKLMVINNLRPFLNEIAKITEDDFTAVENFNNLMGNIALATFLGKLTDLIAHFGGNGDLPGVITSMKTMYTQSLRPFIKEISGITDADKEAIGKFNDLMGTIVEAAFLEKIANVINQLGPENKTITIITSLKDAYTTGLRPFITEVSAINDADKKAVDNFNSIMWKIVGATFYNKLSEIINKIGGESEVTTVLNKMKDMVGNGSLQSFLTEVRKINDSDPAKAANFTSIMGSILGATFYDKIGGVITAIGGSDVSLSGVYGKLETAASEMKGFLKAASEIDEADAKGAQNFSSVMMSVCGASFFDKLGGVIESLGGDKNLTGIFSKLETGASEMKGFLTQVKDITDDEKKGASKFASIMTSVFSATFFGKISSALADLGDGSGLVTIGSSMSSLTTELSTFLTNVTQIKQEHVDGANFLVDILRTFIESQALGALGKVISWLTGDSNLKDLFTKLNEDGGIADGVVEFSKKVSGQNFVDASVASQVIQTLMGILSTNTKGLGNFLDFITGKNSEKIPTGISYLTTEIIPKISELQDSISKNSIDASLISSSLHTISEIFDLLKTDTQNLTNIGSLLELEDVKEGGNIFGWGAEVVGSKYKYQDELDQIGSSFSFIADFIIPKLKEIQTALNGDNFSDIGKLSGIISSVFQIFGTTENDISSLGGVNIDALLQSFTVLDTVVVQAIKDLQDALIENSVDSDYVDNIVGSFAGLIQAITDFKSVGLSESDVAAIGGYIITGLINALDEGVDLVKAAAGRVAAGITEGLKLTLEIRSPSKVAEEIGKFITQGLTNGLLAGEPLTWRMAREFGEGTIKALQEGAEKYDEYGLTEHAINMVTEDLLDENIFNMPDFSFTNRFGNEDVDFGKMAKWLHEKFDEEFSPEYINSFVGSYEQAMKEIPQVINDEDYAKLMTGISAGDFGLSEQTIIDALTEELGSVDDAKLAWQDYNDVKEGTLKINQDLLKQQKQNPPMTLEQYMEMLQKEEENYQRVLSGEFDELARQNGTDRYTEMQNAGLDAAFMQMQLDRAFSEYLHPMTQEEKEAYIYAREQERYLKTATKETVDATQSAVEANNELSESIEYDINDIRDEQKAIRELTEVTSDYGTAVDAATDAMDDKNGSLADQITETSEVAEVTQEAADAQNELATAIKETANGRTVDYKAADRAITAIKKGTAATEEDLAELKKLQQETITYGTYDVAGSKDNRTNRKAGWAENGISAENIEYMFGSYDLAATNLEKLNAQLKETEKNITGVGEAAENAGSSTGTLIDGLYDRLPDTFKSFAGIFTNGYDDKGSGIKVKLSDVVKFIPDKKAKNISSLMEALNLDKTIEIPVDFKIPDGASVQDYISTYLVGMFSEGEDAAGTAIFSVNRLTDFVSDFVSGKDLSKYFDDAKKAIKQYSEAADTATKKTGELNSAIGQGSGQGYAQIDYAQEYMQEVNEKVATDGYKKLEKGLKVNKEQAAELQKIWYNAVQGSYGSDFVEHLKENFGIDWDELNSVITPSGNFNPDKVNPYLDYAESLIGNEDYKNENLFQDILDGKFGSDKDRREAVEMLGYDYDKIQDQLNKYKRGEMSWDELIGLGESYGKVTDEEKDLAEQHKKLLETLNTTPEGAFRSIADFLEGVTSVLEDPETSKNFTNFINEVVGSLKTIELPNASQFEIIGNFLTSVRNAARESTGIVKDFKDFVDGIKGSVEELGTITIDNPDGLDQVKEFLNSIKIENKEVLDTVAAFIGNIVEFATGANAGEDYSTKLVEAFAKIEYAINHLDIDPNKTKPIQQFLDDLTKATGVLSDGGDNIIQTFINNFYGALEGSTSQANSAAATIAKAIKDVFEKEYDNFQRVGRELIVKLCLGILQVQTQALAAAETIASAIMTGIKDGAVSKAGQAGTDFVTNLVGGLTSEGSKAKIKDALGQLFGETPEKKPKSGSHKMTLNKEEKEETEEKSEETANGAVSESGAGTDEGTQYGQNFVAAMAAAIQNGSDSISGAITSMVSGLANASVSFDSIIQSITTGFATLATTLTGIAEAEGEGSLSEATSKINSLLSGMVPDGGSMASNMIDGIVQGIIEGAPKVKAVMAWLAGGAQGTFNYENKAASPAKKYIEFAGYITDGIAIGLQNGASDVNSAMAGVAGGALDRFSSAIAAATDMAENELNLDPVITPVIDLSNVNDAASDIDAALSTNRAIDISTAEKSKFVSDKNNPASVPGTQVFNQYNYSPKPLSRLEIYRQTRNQFAMLKGVNQPV